MYNEEGVIRHIIRSKYGHLNLDKEELFQVGYLGYLKAMQNFDEYYGTLSMKYATSYIMKELSTFVQDHYSRSSVTSSTPVDEMSIPDHMHDFRDLDLKLLLKNTTTLTSQERKVILCIYLHDMDCKSIAELLELSPQRISQLKKSGINKLKKSIKKELTHP